MGQNLVARTVSSQRDPIFLVITRCETCSYFPAFPFSTQAQCFFHRAWCDLWDVALYPSCTQLTQAFSALTALEGNLWCLVLAAFSKRSASVSSCVPFVLQGSWGRWIKFCRRQELEEHFCQGKPQQGPPFPSTHPLSPLFQFHPAPLVHEHKTVKCSLGLTITSSLGWCLTHLSAPSALTGISGPTCASLLGSICTFIKQ